MKRVWPINVKPRNDEKEVLDALSSMHRRQAERKMEREQSAMVMSEMQSVGSQRSSNGGENLLAAEIIQQRLEAGLSIGLVLVCIADLYVLAPRLAFSGIPVKQKHRFHRIMFFTQQVASILFMIIYVLGIYIVRSIERIKREEANHHISEETKLPEVMTKTSLADLDRPITIITQVVLASLIPTLSDCLMIQRPKARMHWKWVGIFRLLHLFSFKYVFETLHTNLTVPFWLPPTFRNTLMLFFNTHYAACILWFCARHKHFSADTWVGTHASFLQDSSENTQYLHSLYFAVITASTVGFGDYTPISSSEVTVMILYVLLNVLLVANIVGGISALATMHDTDIAEQRIRISRFSRMLQKEGISDNVTMATTEYLRLGLKLISFDSRCDIDSLPVSVRIRIRDERFGHLIQGLPLFAGVSNRFIAKCIAIAKDDAFVKGLEIVRAGDLASRLCIILDGRASIELPTNFQYQSVRHRSSRLSESCSNELSDRASFSCDMSGANTVSVSTLSVGSSFGAESFVCQLQQPYSIVANSLLRVISFDDVDRRELEANFPNDWFKVRSNLLENVCSMRRASERLVARVCEPHDVINLADIKRKRRSSVVNKVVHLSSLQIHITATVLHPNCIEGFAALIKSLESSIRRETSKASHQLSAMHCHIASTGDDTELRRLLDMVPVEAVPGDYDGRAPLHLAAAQGHLECVNVLCEYGAEVNPVDRFGRTPLVEAVLNGHDEIISSLVDLGGDLKLPEQEVASRLCDAASKGDLTTLKRYLQAGASPNAADYDFRTPLMLASAEGNLPLCRLLLDCGANKDSKDRWGHTAYDEAVTHNHSGSLLDLLSLTDASNDG